MSVLLECFDWLEKYHRANYFWGYKISRIIGNLLQREIFVDKFSRMKVVIIINIVTREQNILKINIFEAQKISAKSLKYFILEN